MRRIPAAFWASLKVAWVKGWAVQQPSIRFYSMYYACTLLNLSRISNWVLRSESLCYHISLVVFFYWENGREILFLMKVNNKITRSEKRSMTWELPLKIVFLSTASLRSDSMVGGHSKVFVQWHQQRPAFRPSFEIPENGQGKHPIILSRHSSLVVSIDWHKATAFNYKTWHGNLMIWNKWFK